MNAESKLEFTKKQVELLKEVVWMGCLWADSLIDARVQNGKSDRTTARKAFELIKKKLNKNRK